MNVEKESKDTAEILESKQEISGKRRLITKGAMGAVPAILTLRSGAAFALNSAEMCVATDNNRVPADIDILSDQYDIWLRKPVYCRTLVIDDKNATETFDVYNEVETAGTDWKHELYDGDTNQRLFEDVGNSGKMKDSSSGVQYDISGDTRPCYILVQVDSGGSEIGIGKTSDGTTPYITNSCWTSAVPSMGAPV